MNLLEVIVTSVDEACAAEQGGADRLELVSDLASEGLTPSLSLVEQVLCTVAIPVRVMLRDNESFEIKNDDEIESLKKRAAALAEMPVHGIVLGFVKNEHVDSTIMNQLLACAGTKPATFHRAIESLRDQPAAIEEIRALPRVDRILTSGGMGCWPERRQALEQLQKLASPGITIVTGGGLDEHGLKLLAASPVLNEFHVGRAARDSSNRIQSKLIHRLRTLLG